MGITTATLHLWGIGKEALAAILEYKTVLRDNNPPWLDVLMPDATDAPALEKLTKKLTKAQPEAAALLFNYFDDDLFTCALYRGGKKAAGCRSGASWAKLGKALDALFGDELAGKAFRYAARCTDLDEQVRLMEETVGTALLDTPDFEPRTVPRSNACLGEIKARETALRRRKNRCVLTELPVEDWPLDWQAQLGLYGRIRSEWRRYDASHLLYDFGDPGHSVPRHPELAFHQVTFGEGGNTVERFLLYSHTDGTLLDRKLPDARVFGPLWVTGAGELVCLIGSYKIVQTPVGPRKDYTRAAFVCLRSDGSFRWQFTPAEAYFFPSHFHTAPDGTITIYSTGNAYTSKDAYIDRINGETGELLCSRRIPAAENLEDLLRVDALKGFVYLANRNELVLLDEELRETARWGCAAYTSLSFSTHYQYVVGSVLWNCDFWKHILRLYDLRTGVCIEVPMEVPAYVKAVLPDGRFLGVNDRGNRLTIFDPAGTVISRHALEGPVTRVRCEGDRVLLLENRSPDTHGFVSEALFAMTSFHVWRLDPVK